MSASASILRVIHAAEARGRPVPSVMIARGCVDAMYDEFRDVLKYRRPDEGRAEFIERIERGEASMYGVPLVAGWVE